MNEDTATKLRIATLEKEILDATKEIVVLQKEVVVLQKETVELRLRVNSHLETVGLSWKDNATAHHSLMTKLDQSLLWQTRTKIFIGTIAIVLGAILMLLYHYAPWLWDALPKHGHTH